MKKDKNKQRGVTLLALVIAIVIILILSSIATYSGIGVIKSTKLTKFTTELKIMQTKVNELYEKNKNGEDVSKYGQDISSASAEVQEQASKVFNELGISSDGYKFYDNSTIKDTLKIDGVEQEVFVNIEKRSVVSYEGIEYENQMYYTLEQLDEVYNVEYEEPSADAPTFDVTYRKLANGTYKVTISNIQYNGNINKWYVKYQQDGQEYWNSTEDMSFVVSNPGKYKIQIENGNVKSEEISAIVTGQYVTDGLVLHLDAINNTGEGDNSHSTTATVWKDLSGNGNDATLQNITMEAESGWNGNSLQLDGIDDYAVIKDSETMKPVAQTIEIVVNRTGEAPENTDSSKRGIIFVRWWGYTVELNAIDSNSQFSISYGRSTGGEYLKSNQKLNLNKIYHLGLTHENNISKMYINSEYENEQTVTPQKYASMSETRIGQYSDMAYTKCDIYAIRMYNRELTKEELEQNYEIDKIRFDF